MSTPEQRAADAEASALKRQTRQAKRKRAVALAADGQGVHRIAALLGVSWSTAADWLKAEGVRCRTRRDEGSLALLA